MLEYFDAYLIGLTATPSRQTFGFFNQNLVMEYGAQLKMRQAVADGVNVNYDVYRIRTQVGEAGGKVDAGYYVDLRDKLTRKVRWEQLDRDAVATEKLRVVGDIFGDQRALRDTDAAHL